MAGGNGGRGNVVGVVLRCHLRTAPGARKPLASPTQPPECEVCVLRELAEVLLFWKMAANVDAPKTGALAHGTR